MDISRNHHKIESYLQKTDSNIKQNHDLQWQKYVELGSKTVKLISYSKDFIPLIEKQLSYCLQDDVKNFSATIIMWHETEIANFANKILDDHTKSRLRLQQLVYKSKDVNFEINQNDELLIKLKTINGAINHFEIFDEDFSKHHPIIKISQESGIITIFDRKNNIYYYGVKDLHPEEFIKQGHIFVQIFNKIIKAPNANLVHGALVGIDNKGILLCAKGQKGKSTLASLAMMQGFDYVSDDYLILEKEGDTLYSYPIYSIITLSPKMYNQLYDELQGKFVSNNARRDKYVIDIKTYHNSFCKKYPVKICMFPNITNDEKPSIVPCKKGQAITQLIYSTIIQMQDKHDIKVVQKLISFVKDFDFYQINLCSNIMANVECLRQFTNQIK